MAAVADSRRSSQSTSEGAGGLIVSIDIKPGKMSEIIDITPKQYGFTSDHLQKPLRERQLANLKKGKTINVFTGKRPNIALTGPKFPVELLAVAAPALAESLKEVTEKSRHVVVLDIASDAVGWFLRAASSGFAIPGSGDTATLVQFPPEVNAQRLQALLTLGQRSYISFALMNIVSDAVINNELGIDKIGWIFANPAPKLVRIFADHLIETICTAVLSGDMVHPLIGALHLPYFRYAMRLAIITKRPEIEKMFFEDRISLTRFQIMYIFECTEERDIPVRKGVARGLLWLLRQGYDLNGLDHVRVRNEIPTLDTLMKEVDKLWQQRKCTAPVPEQQDVQLYIYHKQVQKNASYNVKPPRGAKKNMQTPAVKLETQVQQKNESIVNVKNNQFTQSSVESLSHEKFSVDAQAAKSAPCTMETQPSEPKVATMKNQQPKMSHMEAKPTEQVNLLDFTKPVKAKKNNKRKTKTAEQITEDNATKQIVPDQEIQNTEPNQEIQSTEPKTVKFAADAELVETIPTIMKPASIESGSMSAEAAQKTKSEGIEAKVDILPKEAIVGDDSNALEQAVIEKVTPVDTEDTTEAQQPKVDATEDTTSLMAPEETEEVSIEDSQTADVAMDTSFVDTSFNSTNDDLSRCKTPEATMSTCISTPSSRSSVSSKGSPKSILVSSREGSPERKAVSFDLPAWTPEEEAELEKKLDQRKIELKSTLRRGKAMAIMGYARARNISPEEARDIIEYEENELHKIRQATLDRLKTSEEELINTVEVNPAAMTEDGFQYSSQVVVSLPSDYQKPERAAPKPIQPKPTKPVLINKPQYIWPQPTLKIEPAKITKPEPKKDEEDVKASVTELPKVDTIVPQESKTATLSKSQIKRAKLKAKKAAKKQTEASTPETSPKLEEGKVEPAVAMTEPKTPDETKSPKAKPQQDKKAKVEATTPVEAKSVEAKSQQDKNMKANKKEIMDRFVRELAKFDLLQSMSRQGQETPTKKSTPSMKMIENKPAGADPREGQKVVMRPIGGGLFEATPVETGQKPEPMEVQFYCVESVEAGSVKAEPTEVKSVTSEPVEVNPKEVAMTEAEPVKTTTDTTVEKEEVASIDNKPDEEPVIEKTMQKQATEAQPVEENTSEVESINKEPVDEQLVDLEQAVEAQQPANAQQAEENLLSVLPINKEPVETKSVKEEAITGHAAEDIVREDSEQIEEPVLKDLDAIEHVDVEAPHHSATASATDAQTATTVTQAEMQANTTDVKPEMQPATAETQPAATTDMQPAATDVQLAATDVNLLKAPTKPAKAKRATKLAIIGEGGIDGEANVESRKAKRKAKKARAQNKKGSEDASSTASSSSTA